MAEEREHVGPYRILTLLGEGGMGSVYLAEQTEPVRRRVAIKVIKLGMDTKQVVARFDAERQALSMMNHPAIAKVLDAGSTDDGRPYFVMEHVKGVPMTEYCDKQKLTIRERLDLFVQVCHAVQHAHQKGIIHRDLKPANVLVHVQDDRPVPKIIDFGIAKATQQRLTERTLFTEVGQIIGTPEYMSPEQAEMSELDVDTRTDVYSLGVMLYELLTGELPLDAQSLRREGYFEIQRRIREEEPPKPSTKLSKTTEMGAHHATLRRTELGVLIRRLRGDLDWIGMKALAKDPTHRYQTAAALAEDIQRHLNDQPVLASPPSVTYRLGKLYRRYKVQFVAGVLLLLSLVAGIVGTTWFAIDASAQAREANRQKGIADRKNQRLMAKDYAAELRRIQAAVRAGRLAGLEARLNELGEEQGGFAWRWLHARAVPPRPEIYTVGRHDEWVRRAVLSPDGEDLMAVTAPRTDTRAGSVRVFSTGDKQRRYELKGTWTDAALSPDGMWIATASMQGELALWKASDGEQLRSVHVRKAVAAICFSHDGRTVAAAGPGGRVWLARTPDLSGIRSFDGPSGIPNQIAFRPPSDDKIVVAKANGRCLVFDAASGAEHHDIRFGRPGMDLDLFPRQVSLISARFSPDGESILMGGAGGRVGVWNARDGQHVRDLDPHEQTFNNAWTTNACAFSPHGRWALSGGDDYLVRVHSMRTGETVANLICPGNVFSLSTRNGGSEVVAGSRTGTVMVFDLAHLPLPVDLVGHDSVAFEVRSTSDGNYAFSVSTHDVRKWDLATGAELFRSIGWGLRSVDLSPDESRLVVGGEWGMGMVLDADTGALLGSFEAPLPAVLRSSPEYTQLGFTRVRYSPDGSTIAAAVGGWGYPRDYGRATPIFLFDADVGATRKLRLRNTLSGHTATVAEMAFSPDSSRLVSDDYNGNVLLWDLRSPLAGPRPLQQHISDRGLQHGLTFGPDGKRIYVPGGPGRIAVYEAATGRRLSSLATGSDTIVRMQLHPAGRHLLVVGAAGSSIWDIASDSHLLDVSLETRRSWFGEFVGDGSGILVSGSGGHVARIGIAGRPVAYAGSLVSQRVNKLKDSKRHRDESFLADVREILDAAPDLDRSVRHALLASVLDDVATNLSTSRGSEDKARALEYAQNAVQLSRPGTLLRARAHRALGILHFNRTAYDAAATSLERANALERQHPAGQHGYTRTHSYLSRSYAALGKTDKAREHLELAWLAPIRGRTGGTEVRLVTRAASALGIQVPDRSGFPMHAPMQAVGPPDARIGFDHPKAWSPAQPNLGDEWLELEYAKETTASTIRVFEIGEAGAVVEVLAVEQDGSAKRLWKGTDPTRVPGILELRIEPTTVRKLRVVLDTSIRPGFNEIDTVQLAGPEGVLWPVRATASSWHGQRK